MAVDEAVSGLLTYVAPDLRAPLAHAAEQAAGPTAAAPWCEVRLRRGGPLHVVTTRGDLWIGHHGVAPDPASAATCGGEAFDRTVQLVTRASVYAFEEQLARGYCTLPGGHRVGFVGRAVLRDGRVATQTEFSGLCIRVARAVPGVASPLMPALATPGGGVRSALVFGPPGSGKTTLLRDLCRQLSQGRPDLRLPGAAVAVCDERSEIAACRAGRTHFDLGPRTDVLDGCPKAEGMTLLLRALGPRVIVTDELGGPGDAEAMEDAARAGVAVLASAHAGSAAELWRRPSLRRLLQAGAFEVLAELDRCRRLQIVPAAAAGPGSPGRRRAPAGPRHARTSAGEPA